MHSLRSRFLDHLGYVRRDEISKATGEHFRSKGHSQADMTISVLEQVKEKNTFYRECRESFNIQHFNLKFKGLNRKRWLLLIANIFKNIYSFLVVNLYLSPPDCCDTVLSDDAVIKTVKCITVLEFETCMCKYNSGRFLDSLSHLTQIFCIFLFDTKFTIEVN